MAEKIFLLIEAYKPTDDSLNVGDARAFLNETEAKMEMNHTKYHYLDDGYAIVSESERKIVLANHQDTEVCIYIAKRSVEHY